MLFRPRGMGRARSGHCDNNGNAGQGFTPIAVNEVNALHDSSFREFAKKRSKSNQRAPIAYEQESIGRLKVLEEAVQQSIGHNDSHSFLGCRTTAIERN